jgi:hypothetical protein
MASQALAPFWAKHLWRRSDAGHESHNICATIANEPKMKLIFTKAHAAPNIVLKIGLIA